MIKKTLLGVFIIFVFALPKALSQALSFPESFRSEPFLFKGMKLAPVPKEIQTRYGIITNPGLIKDVPKTRGILKSGGIPGVQAVYYEIYNDVEEESMGCAFEVAQFKSEVEMQKILPKGDNQEKNMIVLTLQNYLIILGADAYKNYGERLDSMSAFFRQKLGAKLYVDRKKKGEEPSVIDDYESKFAPQVPPPHKGGTISVDLKDLTRRIAKINGMAYILNKKREKLTPGEYRAVSTYPAYETLEFTIDKDSLLDGDYIYYYAEEFSKSPSKESKLTYDHGLLTSETLYSSGQLLGTKNYSTSVVKQKNDYLITIKTLIKNPGKGDKEVVTVFRNQKPVSKTTTRQGISVIRKDFETGYLEEFNSTGKLVRVEKPGLIEKYNVGGEVIYKEEWTNGSHYVSENGKLIKKEIPLKTKGQYLVTEYDVDGKVIREFTKAVENSLVVGDPDEYEDELSENLLTYYKRKAQ